MADFFNKCLPRQDRPAFIFILVTGTINHFLYEWTNSAFFALFCPINESTWEHLKLLFFPFLMWILWQYFRKRPDVSSYFYYRLLAILCGMLCIVTLFYTYTGIIGRNFLVADILIFIAGIIFTLRCIPEFTKTLSYIPSGSAVYTAWAALLLCFFLFTCYPPDLPLFIPPAS